MVWAHWRWALPGVFRLAASQSEIAVLSASFKGWDAGVLMDASAVGYVGIKDLVTHRGRSMSER